jgi:hypothetical protein
MEPMRMADVVARVVAWHNRHPLARRIGPDDVGSVGVVALPFAVAEHTAGSSTPSPTPSHTPARDAVPLFDGHWLNRAGDRDLGRWVRRHGAYPLPACAGWPSRQIDADLALSRQADRTGRTGRTLRHVILATVERGGHQIRVLVAPSGPQRRAAVWGPRLWSAPRSALAGALALAAAGWVLAPSLPTMARGALESAPHATIAAVAGAAASGPAAAVAGHQALVAGDAGPAPSVQAGMATAGRQDPQPSAVPGSESSARVAAGHVSVVADAPAAAAPARPVDVPVRLWDPQAGEPPLVSIRPQFSDAAQRRARVEAATVRQARAAIQPESAPTDGPVYALVTRATRQRADAQGQLVLLQGLQAQSATGRPTRVELMARGGRWQVVWGPLADRRRAEDLLLEARARGLKVQIVSF